MGAINPTFWVAGGQGHDLVFEDLRVVTPGLVKLISVR